MLCYVMLCLLWFFIIKLIRSQLPPWTCWARHIKSVGGVVFFRLSYFDYSDLQLFAIFRFEVDFSETCFMTSAKNSVSGPPNLKLFWGRTPRDPPTRLVPSALAIMRPRYKNSSFGPVYASAETHLIEVCLVTLTVRSVCEREKEKRTCYSPFSPH